MTLAVSGVDDYKRVTVDYNSRCTDQSPRILRRFALPASSRTERVCCQVSVNDLLDIRKIGANTRGLWTPCTRQPRVSLVGNIALCIW